MSYADLCAEIDSFMAKLEERYDATGIIIGVRTKDSSDAEGGGFFHRGCPLQNYAHAKRFCVKTEAEWVGQAQQAPRDEV